MKLKSLISESLLTEATRSQVGVIDKNGNIVSTYVHYDGYPEGVGKTLKKHFNGSKTKQLLKIDKGIGISFLEPGIKGGSDHSFSNPKKGETVFYGRDRGETGGKFMKGKLDDVSKYIKDSSNSAGADYVYLFNEKDGKWYYAAYNDKELKLL